jgi:hypothetical protein
MDCDFYTKSLKKKGGNPAILLEKNGAPLEKNIKEGRCDDFRNRKLWRL